MCFLNCLKDGRFLISTDCLFHNFGPRYLIECLPYVTVLKRDMVNSDDLKENKESNSSVKPRRAVNQHEQTSSLDQGNVPFLCIHPRVTGT